MKFEGFIGPTYTSVSPNASAERALNLVPEFASPSSGAKGRKIFVGRPGYRLFHALPTGPVRGLTSGEDRLFAATDQRLYEVFANATSQEIGVIATDVSKSPVEMYLNGNQLFVVSAGRAYIHNGSSLKRCKDGLTPANVKTGTLDTSGAAVTWVSGDQFDTDNHSGGDQITINSVEYTILQFNSATSLTLTTSAGTQSGVAYQTKAMLKAVRGGFLNGYFLAQQPKTAPSGTDGKIVRISALYDGSSWDALDFIVKEGRADSIEAIHVDHLELYLLGRRSAETWRAEGNQFQIFERDPGGFAEFGLVARYSVVSLAGGVFFLAGDDRGQVIALRMRGLQPSRVSTHAVEQHWTSYIQNGWSVSDAIAYGYVESGHQMWVINFPNANRTWVYDVSTELWHEWGWFDGTSVLRFRGRSHALAFNRHYIGDWQNTNIYEASFTIHGDNEAAIRYQRTAPHLHEEQRQTVYHSFRLDMDTGTAIAGSVNTSGTAVTWVSGDKFDVVSQGGGKEIMIASTRYTILVYNSPTSLTLTTSAGTQSGATYSTEPFAQLDWSEDDGVTFSAQYPAGTGVAPAQDATARTKRLIWRRLGKSRDRVFRVTLDGKARQAWTDAYLEVSPGSI